MAFCVTYERANTQTYTRTRKYEGEEVLAAEMRTVGNGRWCHRALRICMRRGALIHARGECGRIGDALENMRQEEEFPPYEWGACYICTFTRAKGNVLEVGARGREHVPGEEKEEEVEETARRANGTIVSQCATQRMHTLYLVSLCKDSLEQSKERKRDREG